MTTIPALTIGGLTRPELHLDPAGNIVLDAAASEFAATYGLQYLYLGCPPGTPWPPVNPFLSPPTDTNSASNTIIEGAAPNTQVNITAHADSLLGFPVQYSLIGDSSGGGFKIDPSTGVVSVANPAKIDFESSGGSYTITVQADDGFITSSQSFTIAVNNAPPSTPVDGNPAANAVAEGAAIGTTVGITAVATDVNGPGVTWSLTADSSNGGFKIDPNTGVVTVANPAKVDFESAPGHAYSVTVQGSDGHGGTSTQTFSISVTDLPPAISSPATASVNEGVAAHSVVYTAVAADPAGGAVTYSLSGADAAAFTIDPATGIVTINASPDFETKSSYNFTIKASDPSGAFTTEAVTLTINDLPPAISSPATAAVNEGVAAHSVVYTAVAADPAGGAVTYSLSGADAAAFTIDPATGIVTINASPDFETKSSYNFTIKASDPSGAFTTEAVTLNVNDLPPAISSPATASVNEGVAAHSVLYTAVA
ncbi:cadherin repeat domain-containing protein, partial [Bradyrhizobium erythrophlei]|uniref:cadherin repeat domain-containing protein n=1 Tax=Bradyrhizobium erythrophlei TaxID=1437360 RepID=UPI0035E5C049